MVNTFIFIEKAKLVHGIKFDYSFTEYFNSRIKIKIICPVHGVFEQRPIDHLSGNGCSKCSGKFRYTNDEYKLEAIEIHGNKYNYSLTDYKNSRTKIKILCLEHGEFEQTPSNHLSGKGCPKCVGRDKNNEQFILEAIKKFGDDYNYSLVNYVDSRVKIKIICSKHGIFEQTPSAHLIGQGCPICRESKGERKIKKNLIDNNIKFIQQKRFPDCKNIRPLPFDFYLPDYNTCIEYDGEQHQKPIKYWGGEKAFIQRQLIDELKTKYCYNNNINLIRVNNIDSIKYLSLQYLK